MYYTVYGRMAPPIPFYHILLLVCWAHAAISICPVSHFASVEANAYLTRKVAEAETKGYDRTTKRVYLKLLKTYSD